LRFNWLTPVFDPFMRYVFPDIRVKRDLVGRMRLSDAEAVLDFGRGTATLAIVMKRRFRHLKVEGLDVDRRAIGKARRKAAAAGVAVELRRYDGGRLPYEDGSFDRVVSCLVFHHLDDRTKKAALLELARVLRASGELYLADLDRPRRLSGRLVFGAVRLLDGRRNTRANAAGELPVFVARAGFHNVREISRLPVVLGEVSCIRGVA